MNEPLITFLYWIVIALSISLTASYIYYILWLVVKDKKARQRIRLIALSTVLAIGLVFTHSLVKLISTNIYNVLVFIVLLLFIVLYIRWRKSYGELKGPYDVNGIEFYVVEDYSYANAWYDRREDKIVVTTGLLSILDEEELYLVLLHEKGHSRDFLSVLSGYISLFWSIYIVVFNTLWIPVLLSTLFTLEIMQLFYSWLVTWFLYLLVAVFITPLAIVVNWMDEHIADNEILVKTSNSVQSIFSLHDVLVKMSIYNLIDKGYLFIYRGIYSYMRTRIILSLDHVKFNIFKELLSAVFISIPRDLPLYFKIPGYVTHPPPWLRIYYMMKEIGVEEMVKYMDEEEPTRELVRTT